MTPDRTLPAPRVPALLVLLASVLLATAWIARPAGAQSEADAASCAFTKADAIEANGGRSATPSGAGSARSKAARPPSPRAW